MVEAEAGSPTENIGKSGGKIGFYATVPVIQAVTATISSDGYSSVGKGTSVFEDSTFTGGFGSKAYHISDVIFALKKCGIMVSA